MLSVEAVRRAQEHFGKGKPMTGEQIRWGLENLTLDQKKLDALGFGEMLKPVATSCADHVGASYARIQTWDGSRWVPGDLYEANQQMIAPMVHSAAAAYAHRRTSRPVRRRPARAEGVRAAHTARLRTTQAATRRTQVSSQVPATRQACGADTERGALLVLNSIEVIYSHVILVLKGVSLSVPRGGIVALLGANGAGKTTTLRAISNLLRGERGEVTKGSIVYDGQRIERLSPYDLVRRGVVQVMEGRSLFRSPQRRGEPADRRIHRIRVGWDERCIEHRCARARLQLLPATEDPAYEPGRVYVRRRAADVRDRPRADGATVDDPARRAVDGLAPRVVEEIFGIVHDLNAREGVSFLLAEQTPTSRCAMRATAISSRTAGW